MDLIIKNGTVVNADRTVRADVGIEKGRIARIAPNLSAKARSTVDAKGMLVLPGGIDMHVHLNLFFCGTYSEGWETATAAAAAGGVTTIIDYAIQAKGSTIEKAVEARLDDARGKVCVDYSLHGGITDWNEKTRGEMDYFARNGIPSFKMFMIYRSQGWMADDGILFSALEQTKKNGALIMLHAESAFVLDLLVERYHAPSLMKKYGAYCHSLSRPCFTEYEAVERAATWAKVTGGRVYIVHVSAAESAGIIAAAKADGVKIWAETCPQYLLLTDSVFKRKDGHLFGTCPQIKQKHDNEGLLKGLKDGALEVLATDTCAFTTAQKAMWKGDFTKIPYGLPGVETLIPTMFTHLVKKNRFSLEKFVALTSANPAKIFGLYPRKGVIRPGADADLVVFDPKRKVTLDAKRLVSACDYTPFQGMALTGYPHLTFLRGNLIAQDGKFVGARGAGEFVKRSPGGKL